jgi:hypothetical protein
MQFTVSKLKQDLASYLNGGSPKPMVPVFEYGNGYLRAVYSCDTPEGTAYVHLNVRFVPGGYAVSVDPSFTYPAVLGTKENVELLCSVAEIRDHILARMANHQIVADSNNLVSHALRGLGDWIGTRFSAIF